MRKPFVISIFCAITVLTACSSPEKEELVEYHNSYIEEINPKAQEIDQLLVQSSKASSIEEAYNIEKNKVKPLVDEITQYVVNKKPDTDIVKEVNNLRVKQFKAWSEAFDSRLKALEVAIETSKNDPEAQDLMQQYEEKLGKAEQIREEADKTFKDFADEHNIKITEN
ncbi:hypothetical protein [Virgibacillus sp. JSM 102003]|uniref:hypothetical protein n=1 Tax=Virgibacillus sp. JSM 102003 TaxID=1562108 RepID=UPI0035C23487